METEANKKKWVKHCANLSIYTFFSLGVCGHVVKNRMEGKTDRKVLDMLVAVITVRDHWRAQALMLEDALPELDGDLRELAESALENYRLVTDVLRETIGLSAADLKTSGIVH